jgi:hypothetical protein
MFENIPPEVTEVGAGAAGSALAVFLARNRPKLMLAGMFIGGCIMSKLATPPIIRWSDYMEPHDGGLVGFLVGLLSMALLAKLLDTVEAIEPKEIIEAIKKRLGL